MGRLYSNSNSTRTNCDQVTQVPVLSFRSIPEYALFFHVEFPIIRFSVAQKITLSPKSFGWTMMCLDVRL